MKHIFLTSQIQFVAQDIGRKISSNIKQNSVFITTAIRDKQHSNLEWHYKNKSSMVEAGFHFDEYDITNKSSSEIINDLSHYESMYIEGGNSFYLLQESQKSRFNKFVTKRVDEGMVYLGTSAGSVIAGLDIEPVRQESRAILAPELRGTVGYKLVNYVVIPHWGQEKRRDLFNGHRLQHMYLEQYPFILISDNQYVEVTNDSFKIESIFK